MAPPRKLLAFGWHRKMRKTDEFSSVFRFRRLRRGRVVDILQCPNGLEYPRLGLVVAKKVLPRAVDRNRVRRVLREAFRLGQWELGGLDVVVRVKTNSDNAAYRADWDEFTRAISVNKPAEPPMGTMAE